MDWHGQIDPSVCLHRCIGLCPLPSSPLSVDRHHWWCWHHTTCHWNPPLENVTDRNIQKLKTNINTITQFYERVFFFFGLLNNKGVMLEYCFLHFISVLQSQLSTLIASWACHAISDFLRLSNSLKIAICSLGACPTTLPWRSTVTALSSFSFFDSKPSFRQIKACKISLRHVTRLSPN